METRDYRNEIILSVLGIVCLILVTVGVTYAVFSYSKVGETPNVITTGSLKFMYTEGEKGISITNAFPTSDLIGKSSNDLFEFKVTGTSSGSISIPYQITLKKTFDSTLLEDAVKVYLTDGEDNIIVKPILYSDLKNVTKNEDIEKILYEGLVNEGNIDYIKNFKLRLWISDKINFNGVLKDGVMTYPYSNKTFKVTVNVYADVKNKDK